MDNAKVVEVLKNKGWKYSQTYGHMYNGVAKIYLEAYPFLLLPRCIPLVANGDVWTIHLQCHPYALLITPSSDGGISRYYSLEYYAYIRDFVEVCNISITLSLEIDSEEQINKEIKKYTEIITDHRIILEFSKWLLSYDLYKGAKE